MTELDNTVTEAPVESTTTTTETNTQKPLTEPQMAVVNFETYYPQFVEKLKNYPGSSQQIKRVWANSALHPLNKEEHHFSYPEEKELFDLHDKLVNAKIVLLLHGLQNAKVLTLHKPLMEVEAQTPSEKQLEEMIKNDDLGEKKDG